jgi:hypothetical protein
LKLRVLRDNIRLTRQAFVEFDLQAMFEGKQYADFALLWRVCHESRVNAEKPEHCWLERWSKVAAEQGLRALDQLRTGVENAVKALGRGYLACPANTELKAALKSNRLSPQDYYRQLLRVVYRFLFLFVAEDRELLFEPAALDAAKERYHRFYSTVRLRRMAERLRGTPHTDLYEGLSLVLTKLGTTGCPDLGLPAIGGLFDLARTPHLSNCRLANSDLLEAIRALAVISDGQARRSVDYRNLGAEELGSVYESLLELQPRFDPDAITFTLQSASGNERKTTGSYYTPTSLITCLLNSALDPVLDEAAKKRDAEVAILNLKVCDPACGSGHFLIAAAHRVAKKLASVRTQEDEPAPDAIRHALRDVIGHCIFGVDINPMAVELCQVALWMEALEPGKPLSFLDHHIQCGNSLLGATPALIAKGIPDEAFEPIEGDEKAVCRERKRLNRQQRQDREQGQGYLFAEAEGSLLSALAAIDQTPDDTLEQIHAKEERYRQLMGEANYRTSGHLLADLWCSAFVVPKRTDYRVILTDGLFRAVEGNPEAISLEEYAVVRRLAVQYQFLHWHLAFPGVFRLPAKGKLPDSELTGWCGGFDVILGNPPWDQIQLDPQEFFAFSAPEIANASHMAARQKAIEQLASSAPGLYESYRESVRSVSGMQTLIHASGRFPLTSYGRLNTAPLFCELALSLVSAGRIGLIVPTGIATDSFNQYFFQHIVESQSLVSLYSFFEIRKLFIDTDSRNPFCLLTLTPRGLSRQATFAFGLHDVSSIGKPNTHFTLSSIDISFLNPNTRTCPVFRSSRDAELTKAIQTRCPVLANDQIAETGNPWGFDSLIMFMMNTASHLFRTECTSADDLPLLEGKHIHQFNHKYAGGDTDSDKSMRTPSELPFRTRYWIAKAEIEQRIAGRWTHSWVIGWRSISRGDDERTMIAAIVPRWGMSNTLLAAFVLEQWSGYAHCLLACFNSYILDYVLRQKIAGTDVRLHLVKQLPILPPTSFDNTCPWDEKKRTLREWCLPRVLELSYTSTELQPFASDLGYDGPPFVWDNDRRFLLRCELDAAFFHLYEISEADADYIMETFSIFKARDIEAHGTYRTKDTILRLYREFSRPSLTPAQYDMLKAMAYVAAFVLAWKNRVESGILETGLVLMANDALRKAYLTNAPSPSRQPGRRHARLLDWMPLAVNQLLSKGSIRVDPKSPEGLPFYIVGPSPFDLTDLGGYVSKAEEAVKVIKKIGEQKARTEVEECVDDPSKLVPI